MSYLSIPTIFWASAVFVFFKSLPLNRLPQAAQTGLRKLSATFGVYLIHLLIIQGLVPTAGRWWITGRRLPTLWMVWASSLILVWWPRWIPPVRKWLVPWPAIRSATKTGGAYVTYVPLPISFKATRREFPPRGEAMDTPTMCAGHETADRRLPKPPRRGTSGAAARGTPGPGLPPRQPPNRQGRCGAGSPQAPYCPRGS